MIDLVATVLGSVLDFATDPFAWVGFASLIAARKSAWGARHARLLHWVGWIGLGIAVFNVVSWLIRHPPKI